MMRSVGRRGRTAILGIACASLLIALASPAEAARRKKSKRPAYNPPYAAMVVDVKSGRTLHAVNEDALRHPASVTKVMTLYLLFEQIERGRLTLSSPLQVSARAAAQPPSKIGVRPGSTIAVEDAIKALVTKSANDVAMVVAENLAGSQEAFAEQMTRKARALGMNRTVFRNPSGLPDPAQVTTARDLTVLARAVQERFPRHYRYFQTRVFQYAGRAFPNHNKLLGRIEGVDGIKTGFIRASGFNLMTNVRTEDRHIVTVVLGGRSGGHRDGIVANLVRSHLPRAYAGARTAPLVAEASERPRPAVVAEAPRPRADVETTATTPAAKPLDLSHRRPIEASGATPAPNLRWTTGPQPILPPAALAYAAPSPASEPAPAPAGKIQARLPAPETIVAKAPAKADPEPQSRAVAAAPRSGWMIQLGALDDEDKAKEILAQARSASGRALAKASPFTEKVVVRGGSTLFRARFSGFQEAEAAQEACRALKRTGFNCFATRG
jgi:D-alanyl-D-alanine carboxypeptidase